MSTTTTTPAKPLRCDHHPNTTTTSKVRVVIRVRPFLSHELARRNGNCTPCASVLDPESLDGEVTVHLKDHLSSRNECYKLDSYFGEDDNNVSKVFDREVNPLIPGIYHGCNATIFAYGATGSGKTYTMQGTDEIPGLIPLAMSTILSLCQSTGSSAEISYYEIYLDKCYDLMEVKANEIPVLEDKDGQVHLKGLSWVPVTSMSEFNEVFSCGNRRRKVAHTTLNDVSSRSHAVLSVMVSTPWDHGAKTVTGKLNLIDLAGNEDNRRTCNEGIRLQESTKINQSLFTLSNVIYALNNNKPRVPYRESRLTRILQDSLGGTSRALMVACLNPGGYQESVHTVSLAARSRHITNFVSSTQKTVTPKVKMDMEAKLQAWLESKGKAKSAQKTVAFVSPFSPRSMSSTKKPFVHHSSVKKKSDAHQWASNLKERHSGVSRGNLFGNGAVADPNVKSVVDHNQEDMSFVPQNTDVTSEKNEKEMQVFAHDVMLQPKSGTPVKLLDVSEKMETIQEASYNESSPVLEKVKTPQSSQRIVLSPINSNIGNISSSNQSCAVLIDPKTPKASHGFSCASDKSKAIGTPLDKFSATSSILKSSLVQEYLDVLNKASREELLELKGIGQKRAEYIIELRETSPLKSLSDLEKIGLSSKQVHNIFSTTARGVFG